MFRYLYITFFTLSTLCAESIKVTVFHPLLEDMVRQIGKDHVEVVNLVGSHSDPHRFDPNLDAIKESKNSSLFVICGMGLETYLDKLKANLPAQATLVDASEMLPMLEGSCEHHHAQAHEHEKDPHWWHSVPLYRRSVMHVTDALIHADPAHAQDFKNQSLAYQAELEKLDRSIRKTLAHIPTDRRHLVTAHAAFQYFCDEYHLDAHSAQGLNREQIPDPKKLAEIIATLHQEQVVAIFPEKESNTKILDAIVREAPEIHMGPALIADGIGTSSYIDMMNNNLHAIKSTLLNSH